MQYANICLTLVCQSHLLYNNIAGLWPVWVALAITPVCCQLDAFVPFQEKDSSHPSEDGTPGVADADKEALPPAGDPVTDGDGVAETSTETPKDEQQTPQPEQSEEESSKEKYRKKRQ